jgi:hypothetical protein
VVSKAMIKGRSPSGSHCFLKQGRDTEMGWVGWGGRKSDADIGADPLPSPHLTCSARDEVPGVQACFSRLFRGIFEGPWCSHHVEHVKVVLTLPA